MRYSEQISVDFYDALGAEGLAARTRTDWDTTIVESIKTMLLPEKSVLDAGCGYGRIAIPLAACGYRVRGVDISPTLIARARQLARDAQLDVEFDIGSMCDLPYEDDSFDVILCLWSAFFELLKHEEQVLALNEMNRVARVGGWALLEGPVYSGPTDEEIASGRRYGPEQRVAADVVNALPRPTFRHDGQSFGVLMLEANIRDFRCYVENWAGRARQFLKFCKS